MQLSDILTSIDDWGYSTDTAATQTRFVNRVYEKICGQERWPFLERQDSSLNAAAGVNTYTLPMVDWRSLDAVRLNQIGTQPPGIDLHYQSPQVFRHSEHLDPDPATPYYWTWMNQLLHLYPVPDQQYQVVIDYIYEPPLLVNQTDVPVLPVPYHDLLVVGTVVRMAHRSRDWIGENFAKMEYDDLLLKMKGEYLVRQRQSSSHVKRSGYYDTQIPYPFIRDGF